MNPTDPLREVAPPLRAEERQQEVIDAAQDPESTLSPNSIEKALVEETKKAGGVAYQFDPASSPGQKESQIKSVFTTLLRQMRCLLG